MSRDTEQAIGWIAHAFDCSGWQKRSLVIASVLLPVVLGVTVVQRVLVADSTTEWALVFFHAAGVVVIVPLLLRIAWRDWRATQTKIGVPE